MCYLPTALCLRTCMGMCLQLLDSTKTWAERPEEIFKTEVHITAHSLPAVTLRGYSVYHLLPSLMRPSALLFRRFDLASDSCVMCGEGPGFERCCECCPVWIHVNRRRFMLQTCAST